MNANTVKIADSDRVLDQIEVIAATSSKNAKEDLLRDYLNDDLFRVLVKQAIDPFITFGVKKLPAIKEEGNRQFSADTIDLLQYLKDRKLTGNAAQDAIRMELTALQPKSRELLTRILKKNLKAGFTASTANKARPGYIYVFKCQLSHKLDDFAEKLDMSPQTEYMDRWIAELKEDGVRGFALQHQNPGGEFFSRSGKPLNASEELKDEVMFFYRAWNEYWSDYTSIVIDGELVSLDGAFNEVVGDVHRKDAGDTMGLKIIDLLPSTEFDAGKSELPYWDRRSMIRQFLEEHEGAFKRIQMTQEWPVKTVEEAYELAYSLIEKGEEGIILKNPHGLWQNKRTKDWLKVKDKNTVDLVVKRLEIGDPDKGFSHCMGAAVVDFTSTDKDGVQHTVEVSVSSGFSIEQREYFWEHQNELIGQLIEVSYHMLTPDFSMRHPVFEKIRDDKPIEDGQG